MPISFKNFPIWSHCRWCTLRIKFQLWKLLCPKLIQNEPFRLFQFLWSNVYEIEIVTFIQGDSNMDCWSWREAWWPHDQRFIFISIKSLYGQFSPKLLFFNSFYAFNSVITFVWTYEKFWLHIFIDMRRVACKLKSKQSHWSLFLFIIVDDSVECLQHS